jgi:hypothetical protein
MQSGVLVVEAREPLLETCLITRLEWLVQNCRLDAIGPSTKDLVKKLLLRSLVLMSCISERCTCQLFCIETIVYFLRIVHSLGKSIWKAFRSEVVAKSNLILKITII